MVVSVEYQAWTSANYNWLDKTTATSAPLQIDGKLTAWIAAVNANPSNATKQITIEKGVTAGTSANFVGWVLKLASAAAGSTTYAAFYSNAATAATFGSYSSYAAGTANGGYGTLTAGSGISSASFQTSANAAEFLVASETADGEEFFCIGFKTATATNSQGCFLIFKDTAGEWSVYFAVNGAAEFGSFYMPTHATPQRNYGVAIKNILAASTGAIEPLIMAPSGVTYLPAAGNAFTALSTPKSPYIFSSLNTGIGFSFARYGTLANGRTAVCMGYSPVFVSYI